MPILPADIVGFSRMISVAQLELLRMRRDKSSTADPLLGVKVKINDSYFLIGLSRADADVARNIDEIATRSGSISPVSKCFVRQRRQIGGC